MKTENPCDKCQLKYSSYCVGCINEWRGMGYSTFNEYLIDKLECEKKIGKEQETR